MEANPPAWYAYSRYRAVEDKELTDHLLQPSPTRPLRTMNMKGTTYLWGRSSSEIHGAQYPLPCPGFTVMSL